MKKIIAVFVVMLFVGAILFPVAAIYLYILLAEYAYIVLSLLVGLIFGWFASRKTAAGPVMIGSLAAVLCLLLIILVEFIGVQVAAIYSQAQASTPAFTAKVITDADIFPTLLSSLWKQMPFLLGSAAAGVLAALGVERSRKRTAGGK